MNLILLVALAISVISSVVCSSSCEFLAKASEAFIFSSLEHSIGLYIVQGEKELEEERTKKLEGFLARLELEITKEDPEDIKKLISKGELLLKKQKKEETRLMRVVLRSVISAYAKLSKGIEGEQERLIILRNVIRHAKDAIDWYS